MKITQDARKYAERHGVSGEAAPARGRQDKAFEFVRKDAPMGQPWEMTNDERVPVLRVPGYRRRGP